MKRKPMRRRKSKKSFLSGAVAQKGPHSKYLTAMYAKRPIRA